MIPGMAQPDRPVTLAAVMSAHGLAGEVRLKLFGEGAGDIIEIERADKKRFMVPLRSESVPEWDETRVVVADGWAEG